MSISRLAHAMGEVLPVDARRPPSADIEDIEKTREGDPDAYQRLVERFQGHVARILWRFTRDRAIHEELVQDVFV
ncbi:MAG: hypothetical protein JSW27_25730, partial [Phycisphaerales bacterium]